MNREKFEKELKNKEIVIDEAIENSKNLIEVLKQKQAAIRADMVHEIIGTKKFKELRNLRTSIKTLIVDTKQVLQILLQKKNAMNVLINDYRADIITETNENEDSMLERFNIYYHRLAVLITDEVEEDVVNSMTNSTISLADSVESSVLTEQTQLEEFQTLADDITRIFEELNMDDETNRLLSDFSMDEELPPLSNIPLEPLAWESVNLFVPEEQINLQQRNTDRLTVGQEQHTYFDSLVLDESFRRVPEDRSQGTSSTSTDEQPDPPELRLQWILDRNYQTIPLEDESEQIATNAIVDELCRVTPNWFTGEELPSSGSEQNLNLNIRNLRQLALTEEFNNIMSSQITEETPPIEHQAQLFENRPMSGESAGPSVLRRRRVLNRNIRTMPVTEEPPEPGLTMEQEFRNRLSNFFLEERLRNMPIEQEPGFSFNRPMPEDQPGPSGLSQEPVLPDNIRPLYVPEVQDAQPTGDRVLSSQEAPDLGYFDSNRLTELAEEAAAARAEIPPLQTLPPTTVEDDLRNTRPMLPFPEVYRLTDNGNMTFQLKGNILFEVTRDFGFNISCPDNRILLSVSSNNRFLGFVHPQGKFYQRDRDLQIQIINLNLFERVARITDSDRLITMHNRSNVITELTDWGTRQIEATTFFDLTQNFTKAILYSEGRHGTTYSEICADLLENANVLRSAAFDRFTLGCITIVQKPNGNICVFKNEDRIKINYSPLTGTLRVRTPEYKVKAVLRPNSLNFFVQRGFNRVISHSERFIIRHKSKTCGFDEYNIFRDSFWRIRNEPRYSSDDEDFLI